MSARLAPSLQASAFAFRSFPLLFRLPLAFAPLGNKRHHHHAGYVNDHMPVTTKIDILDEEVAATGLAVGLPHRRDVASQSDEASFMADRLQGIQNRLVGILRAAGVLREITVFF